MQALREKYPDGLPAAEEIRRQRENVISLRQLEKRQGTLVLSMEDRQVIEEGAPLFSDRVRVADDLDRLEAGQRELAALSIGNRAVMPEEETEQLEKYTRIFHFRLPDDAELSEKQQDCRRIAELCAVRDAKQAQKNEKKRPGSAKIAILALGALLLLAGIGCLVAEKLSLGIAAVVLGALSLAAALLWKKPLQAEDGADEEMRQIGQLQDGVTAFLLQFYPDASRPDEQLVQLRLDKDAYLRLREKEEHLAKERQEQQVQIDALTAEIRAILTRYGLADSEQTLSASNPGAARTRFAVCACTGTRAAAGCRTAGCGAAGSGAYRMSLRRFLKRTGYPGNRKSSCLHRRKTIPVRLRRL